MTAPHSVPARLRLKCIVRVVTGTHLRPTMEQTIASLTREDATWKKRYLLPTFTCGKIAQNQRSRGIFSSDFAGVMQVYSWDRDSGNIEVKTDSPSGQREAWISADGQWVVFHKDSEGVGSELGHFAAVPFVGSSDEVVDVIDVTPGLSPYGAVGFATGSGRVAMSIAVDGGQTILVKDGGVVGATTRTFRRIDTLVQTRAMELSTCGRFLAQESNERCHCRSHRCCSHHCCCCCCCCHHHQTKKIPTLVPFPFSLFSSFPSSSLSSTFSSLSFSFSSPSSIPSFFFFSLLYYFALHHPDHSVFSFLTMQRMQ